MKNYIILFLLIGSACFYSCEKEEVALYKEESGVYFRWTDELQEMSYSFYQNPKKKIDTVQLYVMVAGNIVNYDRVFNAVIVEGDNTTASADSYKVLNGIIHADSTYGYLPIKVFKTEKLKTGIYSFEVALESSDDFPVIDLALCNYKISLTALLIKPTNWDLYCSIFFGDKYSDKWFKFIVETTGDAKVGSSMDAWFEDFVMIYGYSKKEFLQMSPDQKMISYGAMVRVALREYNKNNPDAPLTHNDGTVVVMP